MKNLEPVWQAPSVCNTANSIELLEIKLFQLDPFTKKDCLVCFIQLEKENLSYCKSYICKVVIL